MMNAGSSIYGVLPAISAFKSRDLFQNLSARKRDMAGDQ